MMMLMGTILLAVVTVDFTIETGKVRPELHSSGFGPQICSCSSNDLADIRAGLQGLRRQTRRAPRSS